MTILHIVSAVSIPFALAVGEAVSSSESTTIVISAVTASTLAVIAAIAAAAVKIINALHMNRQVTTTVMDINKQQTKRLDEITILVNGGYGAVLQELADLKLALSVITGLDADRIRADEAQRRTDTHNARVRAAEQHARRTRDK